MKITTQYQGGMRFAGGEGSRFVVMDGVPEVGGLGEALTPKQMVLQGLAGCTGMDVAAILRKKEVSFENLSVDIEAEQTKSHPKVFRQIGITYRVKADLADKENVERAIELSTKQFCGVSAMLGKTAEITWNLDFTALDLP